MIGKRIARLRKKKGWTQKDLAEATKLSKGYIAAIEKGGSPGVKAVVVIAEALGVGAKELFEEDEDG